MELIIKPTSRCNFACKFCSAGDLHIKHLTSVTPKLKSFIQQLNPSNVIITGGDPLCTTRAFYDELLSLGSWHISITTNLKAFYEDPDTWTSLFKNPRVGVCTSFQYGEGRMWDAETPYTEEMFRKVFDKFLRCIGYRLKFISVIGPDNESRALDHLYLAKALQTKCKLNGVMPLGKSTVAYPMYKIIELWLQAYEKGLRQFLDSDILLHRGGCNLNINCLCSSTIRSIQVQQDGSFRITSCEDDLVQDVQSLLPEQIIQQPTREPPSFQTIITSNCPFCELFYICNSCRQYRKLNKTIPDHCQQMLKLKDRIFKAGWKIQ